MLLVHGSGREIISNFDATVTETYGDGDLPNNDENSGVGATDIRLSTLEVDSEAPSRDNYEREHND